MSGATGFATLMQRMQQVSAQVDVQRAQHEHMSTLRQQTDRLHKLLCCAPTTQALAAELVNLLGSASNARVYVEEMRGDCNAIVNELAHELLRHSIRNLTEGQHD